MKESIMDTEQVCFDQNLSGIAPETVQQLRLGSGRLMPAAAFGTFHSDWAQAYMKDATVEAMAAYRHGAGLRERGSGGHRDP